MSVVKNALPEADLKVVGEALQGALVDLVDLALVAKQVHWNVVGPRFRSVHLQLDEATVASASAITGVTEGWIRDVDAVRILVDALSTVITRMRERIASTDEPDPVTQDILIALTGELEKHHWMFAAESA